MERETFVGIDVGTTKVVALIGEVGRDGGLTIIGKGIVPASGLRKGIVVNIDQTVHSISAAVEKAERHAGYKIERAFVGLHLNLGLFDITVEGDKTGKTSSVNARLGFRF